ncbi:MAG: type II toxin-antitoxin system HipA family toxin [Gammaproteobacteria bacterium]
MTTVAEVQLWGRRIGAVSLAPGAEVAEFEYASAFANSGIEVAPLMMPLSASLFRFPELARASFHGLPGLLADSLPDKFGNALIDAWLATQGREPQSFNAVERLCYIGERGIGALEYLPATGPRDEASPIEIEQLVALASDVLTRRNELQTSFDQQARARALTDILQVGTSAGGARAKAVVAWNPASNEVRSGQLPAEQGFEHWLLKFDGVSGNKDKELEDPLGYGAIEYAYYQMATACGIHMEECRLLEENGRRHFMTRRFDRRADGRKLHMQSLAALAHYDFNLAGAYSYEQALLVMRKLKLPMAQLEEQFRRMVFNLVARNQDDHVKNIAFLMDKDGRWFLSPAYDMTYSYNPEGLWTASHQMSVNGKRDNFSLADLNACAKAGTLKRGRAETILEEVQAQVARWPEYAAAAGVSAATAARIERALRLQIH